jgi:hypothetical protein
MTTIKVNTITDAAGTGAPNIPDGILIKGSTLANANTLDYYAQGTEPSSPKNAAVWYDTGTDQFKMYVGGSWVEVSYSNLPVPFIGETGVFSGGYTGSYTNVIQYITIATTGNATDFGNLTAVRSDAASCSNRTRGVFAGGYRTTTPDYSNVIDYITIATIGNATDFGDLIYPLGYGQMAGCSDGITGLFGGGRYKYANYINNIEYITIATPGNATDFGDLTTARRALASCASLVRGLFAGGAEASPVNIIDYVTIATPSNATDFGDLTTVMDQHTGCSNSVRGIFAGAYTSSQSRIDYVTIATTGNATDFGDLTVVRKGLGGCANDTRAVFGGGYNPSTFSRYNTIDYITIATPGNATDFGDLLSALSGPSACSGD